LYLDAIEFKIEDATFQNLNTKQAQILIKSGKVAFGLPSLQDLLTHYSRLGASWAVSNWSDYLGFFDQVQHTTRNWISLLKEVDIESGQREYLLQKVPNEQVIPLLEVAIEIPDLVLQDKQVSASYAKLIELTSDSIVSRNSVALILIKNLAGLEDEEIRTVLSRLGTQFSLLVGDGVEVRVEKSHIMEKMVVALHNKHVLVKSFEIKLKYIHIELMKGDDEEI